MFGIGSLEFIIIIAVILIFLSPKDLISLLKFFKKIKTNTQSILKKGNSYIENIIEETDISNLKKEAQNTLNSYDEEFYKDLKSIKDKKFKESTNFQEKKKS